MWWDKINEIGPRYGYDPKESKSILVLKNRSQRKEAEALFGTKGVKITTSGERHLGAVIGTDAFKQLYVKEKIGCWIADVKQLSQIAVDEPQAALSAYNIGLSQRWKFVQRTIEGTSNLFVPLEEVIRNEFIPAICGCEPSDMERRMFALPYRYGGLGIVNPVMAADGEYQRSLKITEDLTNLIREQEMDFLKFDKEKMRETKNKESQKKEKDLKKEQENICNEVDEKLKRLLLAAGEKGASSWLSALPLKKLGYTLNKQEFKDAISLRYGWEVPGMPRFCGCGKPNSMDHILTCKKRGYVSMRHNVLRNTEAKLMEKVQRRQD